MTTTTEARPNRRAAAPRPLSDGGRLLAETHAGLAYFLAGKFARNYGRDEREETRCEALLALSYAASRYDPARGVPFENYAALVIKHALADHARRNQKRRALFAAPAQDDDPEPADHRHAQAGDDADRVELAELIRRTLPPRLAEVLFAVAEGVTLEEIGRRFGVTRERVRQLKEKAAERIRASLAARGL
jgi:RNA polymerase sigma factor (sigma-70 family)